ncbi:type IV secretion system protein [Bartonella sp. AD13SXNS]|uniref:type IV secretion system protein n=1 Tax=Bartonella sp. AD13SXNS TaxID=3243462 RepID=UPI0035CFD84F
MKKQVISIAVAIMLGTPSLAMAWSFGLGTATLAEEISNSLSWGSSRKAPKKPSSKKPSMPQYYIEIIQLIKQQLEQARKTHQSITGNRQFDIKNPAELQTDHSSFFLKNPEIIYNKNIHLAISQSLESVLKEEEIPVSIRESRDSINKRIQYATAIDKIVSLQTFQETENRFNQISELLKKINTTTDLKSIAELQAHIKGMLAMIQNETTKLQMVAYSRNTERALISQQKQKRNMKILNSENKGMPIIRSIR